MRILWRRRLVKGTDSNCVGSGNDSTSDDCHRTQTPEIQNHFYTNICQRIPIRTCVIHSYTSFQCNLTDRFVICDFVYVFV